MATIKQYVNLPRKPKDHHGARVTIQVEAAQLGKKKVGTSQWWVEPDGGNTDLKYLSKGQRAQVANQYVRNVGDKFRNTLVLPHVGGDKHKAKCAKKGDKSTAKESDEYQTWRKIFYTVHWMNQDCKDIFDAVKGKFEDAFKVGFVELEKKADSRTKKDEPRTYATPPHLPHLYARRPELSDKPFHLRIVVLRDIYDAEVKVYTWGSVASDKVNHDISPVELSDHTPRHWLKRARARILPGGTWVDVRRYAAKTGDSKFEVDLHGSKRFSKAVAAGKSLTIEVTVRERSHYLGHSLGNFVCVRINEAGTRAAIERTILQTFTHEVGHGLQQTVRREALYKADGSRASPKWENNPMWHTDDYGGQGPHCHKNAKVAASTHTTSGNTYVHDAGDLCTMFFRDDAAVQADGKFCDHCEPRVKRANLGRAQMDAKGWMAY
jgi:hypothetical protein